MSERFSVRYDDGTEVGQFNYVAGDETGKMLVTDTGAKTAVESLGGGVTKKTLFDVWTALTSVVSGGVVEAVNLIRGADANVKNLFDIWTKLGGTLLETSIGNNDVVLTNTKVEFALNEATHTLDVPLVTPLPKQVLVSVKNISANTTLTVTVSNFRTFDGVAEAVEIDRLFVAASGKGTVLTSAFPRGTKGQISITRDTAAVAASDVWVTVNGA